MRDIFIEILTTIKHNRLRTALTGFSVAWGIFILIVLLGAGNGLINATMGNSSRYLSTSMVVSGGATSKAYDGLGENRDVQLNDKDFNITSEGFPNNVESVGAELSQQGETLVNGSDYTTGINLSGCELPGASFFTTNATNATFIGADLTDANFFDSNVTGAVWGNTICPDEVNSDDNGDTCCGAFIGAGA